MSKKDKNVTVIFKNEDSGQEIKVALIYSEKKESLEVKVTGANPDNLKEHSGFHISLLDIFLNALK